MTGWLAVGLLAVTGVVLLGELVVSHRRRRRSPSEAMLDYVRRWY